MKTYRLIIEPKNKDQWTAIKAFLAAHNVKHVVESVPSEMTEAAYYQMLEERIHEVNEGKTVAYTSEVKKDLFE